MPQPPRRADLPSSLYCSLCRETQDQGQGEEREEDEEHEPPEDRGRRWRGLRLELELELVRKATATMGRKETLCGARLDKAHTKQHQPSPPPFLPPDTPTPFRRRRVAWPATRWLQSAARCPSPTNSIEHPRPASPPRDLAFASVAHRDFRRIIAGASFPRLYRSPPPPQLLGILVRTEIMPVEAPHPRARRPRPRPRRRLLLRPPPGVQMASLGLPRDGRVHLMRSGLPDDLAVLFPDAIVIVLSDNDYDDVVLPELAVYDPFTRGYMLLPPIPDSLVAASVRLSRPSLSRPFSFLSRERRPASPFSSPQAQLFSRPISLAHAEAQPVRVFFFPAFESRTAGTSPASPSRSRAVFAPRASFPGLFKPPQAAVPRRHSRSPPCPAPPSLVEFAAEVRVEVRKSPSFQSPSLPLSSAPAPRRRELPPPRDLRLDLPKPNPRVPSFLPRQSRRDSELPSVGFARLPARFRPSAAARRRESFPFDLSHPSRLESNRSAPSQPQNDSFEGDQDQVFEEESPQRVVTSISHQYQKELSRTEYRTEQTVVVGGGPTADPRLNVLAPSYGSTEY
ncbi:hypothetical protein HU200_019901 [Digitaria exilis]|uniref:Uncharacterized protein n=1 Tax=Digitaria exilis TaxID=1010633 RepID=A0A835F144_9POAL|nr:hypothetical protein HU200_019901 [Digitaria exilis]